MYRSSFVRAAESAAAVLLLGLLLMFPQQVVTGAREGLRCCAEQLIPALYPFLVVCQLVVDCPAAALLGRVFLPYLRLLGIGSPAAGTALLMGLLGGFAPAGRCVARLRQTGRIDSRQAQVLLVACAGSGPGFVVNSVGVLMLGSAGLGWILAGCQTAASLLCALAVARLLKAPLRHRSGTPRQASQGKAAQPESSSLSGAIGQAAQAMLAICGTVVLFRCLYQILTPALGSDARISAAAAALLEITSGCLEAARLPGSGAVYGSCAALSLLSGSVFFQLRALTPRDVSLQPLLLTRPLHLLLSLGTLHLALRFLPEWAAQACADAGPVRIVTTRARPDAALALFALCCLVLFRLQKADAERKRSAAPPASGM